MRNWPFEGQLRIAPTVSTHFIDINMTTGIIAIKGNHLDKSNEIFKQFRYIDLNNDKQFVSGDKALNYLFDNYFEYSKKDIALRGVTLYNNWTIVCDPEMVDLADEEKLLQLSKILSTDIFTFLIETVSGTFEFVKYNDSIKRQFCVSDTQIMVDEGEPLKEEIRLNINESIFIDDILKLAENIGIDIELKKCENITVKELGFDEELKKVLSQNKSTTSVDKNLDQKPWWKIW
jgi:hypothetical protein